MAPISGRLQRLTNSDHASSGAISSNTSEPISCATKNKHQAKVTRRVYRTTSPDRAPRALRARMVTIASRPGWSETSLEVVPAIHADLGGRALDIIAAGASIGAFNAVAVLCRYPDVFGAAIGMSGSYRIERFYDEAWSQDLYYSAPLQFLPGLEGAQLDRLRQRRVILASGEGEWEDIGSSWQMAAALGGKGIPNRVDNWGPQWAHQWPTWREMLPQYLRELT